MTRHHFFLIFLRLYGDFLVSIMFELCGLLQCIASTTVDEYRTYFENDKALARRFQPVLINEPNQVGCK